MEINKPIRNIDGTAMNKRLATKPKLVVSITSKFCISNLSPLKPNFYVCKAVVIWISIKTAFFKMPTLPKYAHDIKKS